LCVDDEIGLIGFPNVITPAHLEKVFQIMKEKGYAFQKYWEYNDIEGEIAQKTAVYDALCQCFHSFMFKILSVGKVMKVGKHVLAVPNPATTGMSGSPYIAPSNPSYVVGNHLGGGISVGGTAPFPNYNLCMSVDHPEWVAKYVKHVVPTIPREFYVFVKPYLESHLPLLKELKLVTAAVQEMLK